MSKLLWILCAFTAVAHAEEGDFTANTITALHFRPAAGHSTLYGNLQDRFSDKSSATQNGSGTSSSTRTSWTSELKYDYAWTDTWYFGVTESYLYGSGRQTTTTAGKTTGTVSKGFSDPVLSASWRYWGSLTGTQFGSLYINFQPALGHQQSPDTNTIGNNLSSSSYMVVGTNLFWVSGVMEYEVTPFLRYTTSGTDNEPNGTNSSDADPFWLYGVSGALRYHVNAPLFVEGVVQVTGEYDIDRSYNNRTNVLKTTTSNKTEWTPSLIVGWLQRENLLLELQYTYDSYGHTVTREQGTTAPDTDTTGNSQTLTLSGFYSF